MFRRILVANRGEIALRILRACREMGVQTVVVYSEADRGARYLELADERRFWKERGIVTGDYNVIDSNGKLISGSSYLPDTVEGGRKKLRQLIELCVSRLPSPRAVPYCIFRFLSSFNQVKGWFAY